MADEVQFSALVVEPEEDRAHPGAVLVEPVAADDAIHRAPVLDLDHLAPPLAVGPFEPFGHDAVEPGRLELVEPAVGRLRRPESEGRGATVRPASVAARWPRRPAAEQAASSSSNCRRSRSGLARRSWPATARRSNRASRAGVSWARRLTRLSAGWMRFCSASKSSLPPSPRPPPRRPPYRRQLIQRRPQLREVAEERLAVAAIQSRRGGRRRSLPAGRVGLVRSRAAPHEHPETVPLGLVSPAGGRGQVVGHFGLHGRDGRSERPPRAEPGAVIIRLRCRSGRSLPSPGICLQLR